MQVGFDVREELRRNNRQIVELKTKLAILLWENDQLQKALLEQTNIPLGENKAVNLKRKIPNEPHKADFDGSSKILNYNDSSLLNSTSVSSTTSFYDKLTRIEPLRNASRQTVQFQNIHKLEYELATSKGKPSMAIPEYLLEAYWDEEDIEEFLDEPDELVNSLPLQQSNYDPENSDTLSGISFTSILDVMMPNNKKTLSAVHKSAILEAVKTCLEALMGHGYIFSTDENANVIIPKEKIVRLVRVAGLVVEMLAFGTFSQDDDTGARSDLAANLLLEEQRKESFTAAYQEYTQLLLEIQKILRSVFRHLAQTGILSSASLSSMGSGVTNGAGDVQMSSLPYRTTAEGFETDFRLSVQGLSVLCAKIRGGVLDIYGEDVAKHSTNLTSNANGI
ncbi:hypothetical protein HK100_001348 [Physocladia obscura]|uniref:Uncharacterized protein n=1 Tax=Physocladia obscura TaxID=109957 RepID=A0AAD5SWY6_9FUNG|nr:hypothetical protein HK100_001348 [Physocladia obscura]